MKSPEFCTHFLFSVAVLAFVGCKESTRFHGTAKPAEGGLKVNYDVLDTNSKPYMGTALVYTFLTEKNGLKDSIFLYCYGEPWYFDSLEFGIDWLDDLKEIHKIGTGVKSTNQRLRIHPPRHIDYHILEFSPFPTVNYDSIEWNWDLYIPDVHLPDSLDGRGGIEMHCKYKNEFLDNGLIKTTSNCSSPMGTSVLVTECDRVLGFIKMDYVNVDSSIYKFKLIDVDTYLNAEKKFRTSNFLNLPTYGR